MTEKVECSKCIKACETISWQRKCGAETNKKGLEEYEDDDFEDFDAFESESSFSTEQVTKACVAFFVSTSMRWMPDPWLNACLQVQELMSVVCNETKFAEIELKVLPALS